eukprot:12911622-Prorocentrum_lima.AAC.1
MPVFKKKTLCGFAINDNVRPSDTIYISILRTHVNVEGSYPDMLNNTVIKVDVGDQALEDEQTALQYQTQTDHSVDRGHMI